jgi:hypothetical protein
MSFLDASEEMQAAIAEKIIELFDNETKSDVVSKYINLSLSISEITAPHYVPPFPPHDTPEARLMVKHRGFLCNLLLNASESEDYEEETFCRNLGLLAKSHSELRESIIAIHKESQEKKPYALFSINPNLENQLKLLASQLGLE